LRRVDKQRPAAGAEDARDALEQLGHVQARVLRPVRQVHAYAIVVVAGPVEREGVAADRPDDARQAGQVGVMLHKRGSLGVDVDRDGRREAQTTQCGLDGDDAEAAARVQKALARPQAAELDQAGRAAR